MTFDAWAAGIDGVTTLWQPCFELQGSHDTIPVDGESARMGTYRCDNFAGGLAWATAQTLVAHDGRGYAIYVWPAEQGAEMPPLAELRGEAERWLAGFSFTN